MALGATTFVNLTSTNGFNVFGLAAASGNVDGQVVCFSNVNSSAFTFTFLHDSASASATGNRFRCAQGASATCVQFGAVWFRYSGVSLRWQEIGRAA